MRALVFDLKSARPSKMQGRRPLASFTLSAFDGLTPLRLWSPSGEVQIGFVSNPWVLASLGFLSLAIIAALSRIAPGLGKLVVWRKGNLAVGLAPRIALEEVLFRGFLQGHLEHLTSALRAALISAIAFAACHSFLALSVTEVGWPILLFTQVEGLVCAFVRMRYGVSAAINPSRQGHAGQERPQGLQLDRI